MYPECMFFPTGQKNLLMKPVEIPDLPVVPEPTIVDCFKLFLKAILL